MTTSDTDPEILTHCPRCHSEQIELDVQYLVDANRFGVIDFVPFLYHCYGCSHQVFSRHVEPILDPPEKLCANCGLALPERRRRWCSQRCARPDRATQRKIDVEKLRREQEIE